MTSHNVLLGVFFYSLKTLQASSRQIPVPGILPCVVLQKKECMSPSTHVLTVLEVELEGKTHELC